MTRFDWDRARERDKRRATKGAYQASAPRKTGCCSRCGAARPTKNIKGHPKPLCNLCAHRFGVRF